MPRQVGSTLYQVVSILGQVEILQPYLSIHR